MKDNIKFPFEYLNEYLAGNMGLDAAIDSTLQEVDRIVEEYLKENGK